MKGRERKVSGGGNLAGAVGERVELRAGRQTVRAAGRCWGRLPHLLEDAAAGPGALLLRDREGEQPR